MNETPHSCVGSAGVATIADHSPAELTKLINFPQSLVGSFTDNVQPVFSVSIGSVNVLP